MKRALLFRYRWLGSLLVVVMCTATISAQHQHDHGEQTEPVKRPRIFLDKSPRVVQYQLKRLDNARLLLVERKTDDAKYAPVYAAILTRAGMSPQYREEALEALVTINASDAASELLQALASIPIEDQQSLRTARQLARMLLRQPPSVLAQRAGLLQSAVKSNSSFVRAVANAGLTVAGRGDDVWAATSGSDDATKLDWLSAVPLIPDAQLRGQLRSRVVSFVGDANSTEVRRTAIQTLRSTPGSSQATFQLVASLVSDIKLRDAAVKTLLDVPAPQRDAATSRNIILALLEHAEATPAAQRTSDAFVDAMQLSDQLLARLPVDEARTYRQRLREIAVRVVRIQTVEEEMRYDTPFFAVEAGRPVQVVLKNDDLMPHNLVITVPGALKEVAELGLAVGPNGGFQGKQYVPDSEKVLHATDMVQPHRQVRLTFEAPNEPGEYPYVCTFPRHWMRMYGVMVVVEDLDRWLQNPTQPKDPVGSNRPFVQAWNVDDLKEDLAEGLRGRTIQIGHQIFVEATCAQCHKVKGEGGAVGPELTDVFKRWKGARLAVLREIVEPSYRIDPEYAVHLVTTIEGQTVSGIVKAEGRQSISLLDNPEATQPTVIQRRDIDEIVKTSTSMMPKALLDRFTKDEIFELLAFLESLSQQ